MDREQVMNVLTEILGGLETLLVTLGLMLWGMIKNIVPVSWLPHKRIAGELVLITGAGSGIGRLMSIELAKLGARLILWDIDPKGNEETAKLVEAANAFVKTYTVDLTKRDHIYETAKKVQSEVGDVDILVNNAGIVTGKNFIDSPDKMIELTMDVNAMAHFWTIKAFLPRMMARNHGHLVSIASAAGLFGCSGLVDYCTSKFAAVGIMESLAIEMDTKGYHGINTTTVCPGPISTGMFKGADEKLMPHLTPEYAASKVIEAVRTNYRVLMMPREVYIHYFMKGFMPIKAGLYLGRRLGANQFMDNFVGRAKKD